jgi:hypothetical protein
MNYTLYQKKPVTDEKSKNYGEEYEDVLGYFTTIENALVAMCRKEVRACKCTTLNGLVKEERILRDCIKGLCEEIGVDNVVKNVIDSYKEKDTLLEEKVMAQEKKKAAKDAKTGKKRGRPKKNDKKN